MGMKNSHRNPRSMLVTPTDRSPYLTRGATFRSNGQVPQKSKRTFPCGGRTGLPSDPSAIVYWRVDPQAARNRATPTSPKRLACTIGFGASLGRQAVNGLSTIVL